MITTPLLDLLASATPDAFAQLADVAQYLLGFGMGVWLWRIMRARG